jgi:hypothetical protein
VIDIVVGTVNVLDLNGSGVVTVADALAVLKYAGEGKYASLPGCTPPGNTISSALWTTSTQAAWLTPATRSRSCSTRPGSPKICALTGVRC